MRHGGRAGLCSCRHLQAAGHAPPAQDYAMFYNATSPINLCNSAKMEQCYNRAA